MDVRNAYVYIVECADGTLYTGWTFDVENRVFLHNAGLGAKYTDGRQPVRLVFKETWQNRWHAMRREAQIKRMTRAKKLRLIGTMSNEVNDD